MDLTKDFILQELNNRVKNKHDLAKYQEIIQSIGLSPTFPIILVAGTNGKGSVCGYISNIYAQAGYKVGCYSSPHVFEYNERIQINNQSINDADLTKYLNLFYQYPELGLFHVFTLSAICYYMDQMVDVAVIEVGIGGRLDITNLFEPDLSIITNIGMDHCDLLGNSIGEIARHKAGIMRPSKTVIYGNPNPPAEIIDEATKINASLVVLGQNFDYTISENSWQYVENNNNLNSLPTPSLRGNNQYKNATTAIKAINVLQRKLPVTLSSIKYGLINTHLVGRFQIMAGTPLVVLDTAHNPPAVATMLDNLKLLPYAKYTVAVFAMSSNKDVDQVIKLAKSHFTHWFVAPIENTQRKIDNSMLAQIFYNNGITENIQQYNSIEDATTAAFEYSLSNDAKIISFGSFLTVANTYLKIKKVRP